MSYSNSASGSASLSSQSSGEKSVDGSGGIRHHDQYVKLNVGGCLFQTTISTLTKYDSMLRAMFSGRIPAASSSKDSDDDWIMIDRSGKHFGTILDFLRDGTLPPALLLSYSPPNDGCTSSSSPSNNCGCRLKMQQELQQLLQEAKYYLIQPLVDLIEDHMYPDMRGSASAVGPGSACCSISSDSGIIRVPVIRNAGEESILIRNSCKPVVKLLINRHNNKYSYTANSDDNLLKNLELFDKLCLRFSDRVLFIKDSCSSNSEICCWHFYGRKNKVAELSTSSIVYATDRKHTKVDFPEARIYEETLNILLFEDPSHQLQHRRCCCCCGCTDPSGSSTSTGHNHHRQCCNNSSGSQSAPAAASGDQ